MADSPSGRGLPSFTAAAAELEKWKRMEASMMQASTKEKELANERQAWVQEQRSHVQTLVQTSSANSAEVAAAAAAAAATAAATAAVEQIQRSSSQH